MYDVYTDLIVFCLPVPNFTRHDMCNMYKNFPSQAIVLPFIQPTYRTMKLVWSFWDIN